WTRDEGEVGQLAAFARVDELLEGHRIDYSLFGGCAVDFHLRAVTRSHDDLDLAVWAERPRPDRRTDGGGRMETPARGARGRLHRLRTRHRPARGGVSGC